MPTKKTPDEEKAILDKVKASEAAVVEEQAAEEVAEDVIEKAEAKTAKAGKRSAKGLKEAEEKAEKIEKQQHKDEAPTEEQKPKVVQKPARTRLERQGKRFRKASEDVDKTKEYTLKEAIELAQKTSTVKFDATVELHVNLGVDPKHADQNIRGTVVLPAGTGKSVKVAVFADVDDVKKAKDAGADIAAGDEFLQSLDKGVIDFDVLIATPKQMAKLGKYAKVLGPKGLMPNPKSGTVATDVAKAVKEAKGGKVEYRVDSTGIVHLGIGKVSFAATDLLQNAQAIVSAIRGAKPASIKGNYILAAYMTTSMGPSIKLATGEL